MLKGGWEKNSGETERERPCGSGSGESGRDEGGREGGRDDENESVESDGEGGGGREVGPCSSIHKVVA